MESIRGNLIYAPYGIQMSLSICTAIEHLNPQIIIFRQQFYEINTVYQAAPE